MTPYLSRRGLLAGLAGATAASTLSFTTRAQAQDAAAGAATPEPRVLSYTHAVGDVEVTTLLDGSVSFDPSWVMLDPDTLRDDLEAAFLDPDVAPVVPITGHLLRRGSEITLVDAGAGPAFGAGAGHLAAALASLGVAPGAVGRVVLTHMHIDHVGGMMTGEAATFPAATVHIPAADLAFWTDEANASAAPEALRPQFDMARLVAATYGDRLAPHEGEADLGGGLSAVPMPGHTPGHAGLRVASGDAQLLLWADLASLEPTQFTRPDTGLVFDVNPAQAADTRRRVLDMVAADRTLVAGTHMPFPGLGHVEARDGAFAWVPERWRML